MTFEVYLDENAGDTPPTEPWAVVSQADGTWTLTIDTAEDLSLIGDEDSVTHNLFIKTTLDDYPTKFEYDQIDVTITEATCDCQYLEWDAPDAEDHTVMVESAVDLSLPTPTPDSVTPQAIHPAFEKCYLDGTDCSEDGRFAVIADLELDGVTLTDGSWITFASVGADELYSASTQTVNVDPTYAEIGEHTLVVTWTTVDGEDVTYTALTLTIECEVASFTAPSQADGSYTVYDEQLEIDIAALTYVQSPACNYEYSGVFAWEGLNNYINVDGSNDGQINVHAIRPDAANDSPYAMSVTVTLTIDDNNGSPSSFAMDSGDDVVTFTVEIINPCLTTAIDSIVFGDNPLVIVDGTAGFTEWTAPGTALDAAKSDSGLCGSMSFELFLDDSETALSSLYADDLAVISVDDGTWRITVDTLADLTIIDDESSVDIELSIKTVIDDWPTNSRHDTFTVRVTSANCDC